MKLRFWISRPGSIDEFVLDVPEATWAHHNLLSSWARRMQFWGSETGDKRFDGPFTALIVEPHSLASAERL